MPRHLQFKRDEVLDCAMMVFWRQGFHGTGIADLVSATGIRRASIYNTFGNKQQFFILALERYANICLENLNAAVENTSSIVKGIDNILKAYKDSVRDKKQGCLLYNTALELSAFDEEVREVVRNGLERIDQFLLALVEQGKLTGEINQDTRSSTAVRLITSAMQSLTIMGCVGAADEVLDDICSSAMLQFRNESRSPVSIAV
jgi:TetR/AcrR family transcriptional repressor of nem operon